LFFQKKKKKNKGTATHQPCYLRTWLTSQQKKPYRISFASIMRREVIGVQPFHNFITTSLMVWGPCVWTPHHCEWSCNGVVEKGCGFSISLMRLPKLFITPCPMLEQPSRTTFWASPSKKIEMVEIQDF
jgi:hypothetical protein